eukprot:6173171-Pleurochrysis_carterae.AAC.3
MVMLLFVRGPELHHGALKTLEITCMIYIISNETACAQQSAKQLYMQKSSEKNKESTYSHA